MFQKRPLQPIPTATIYHDGNDDKNVGDGDDELEKDGDDRHLSFVIAIGHWHNDGVSKSVVFVCVC